MSERGLIIAFSAALLLNMAGFANIGVVLPAVSQEFGLDAAAAGLLGGAFFAAYALGVPLFVPLTDRMAPLRIYAVGSCFWIAGALCVVLAQDGLALPLIGRILSGLGMAATYMPGLMLLVARLDERRRSAAAATYASCITLGTACSFAVAGAVALNFPWRTCFVAAAVLAAVALPLVVLASRRARPIAQGPAPRTLPGGANPLLRRPFAGWLAACAGNGWEGMALRTWWIAFLVFCAGTDASGTTLAELAIVTSVAGLVAMPISVAVSRWATGRRRLAVVMAVCLASAMFAPLPPLLGSQSLTIAIVLTTAYLCVVFADSGSLSAAIVDNSPPERRGTALAAAATASNVGAFAGATTVGLVLQLAGGPMSASAWIAGFATMGAGSAIGALALFVLHRRRSPAVPESRQDQAAVRPGVAASTR